MSGQIVDPATGQPMKMDGVKNVVGDDELRARQAAEEVRQILEAYDCDLFPVLMLSPKGVIGTSVDIVPKSRQRPSGSGGVSSAGGIQEASGLNQPQNARPLAEVPKNEVSPEEEPVKNPSDGGMDEIAGPEAA